MASALAALIVAAIINNNQLSGYSPEFTYMLEEESLVVQTVADTEDAVVSVIVTRDLPVLELRGRTIQQRGTEEQEVGGGTAFFVSADGLLLTNNHVVALEDADYTVLLNDGRRLEAEVVARDSSHDIALLEVDGIDFASLELSRESPLLGQTVIAIGNSLGEFRNTVSVGVVSGLQRSILAGTRLGGPVEQLDQIIQTDAAINEGNSGGPLLNLAGEVIGMNTAIATRAQNIGFSIPAADLRRAINSYRQHGEILYAFLGVQYVPVETGALVIDVVPESPADGAGLRTDDIILEIDGQQLGESISLSRLIQNKNPGETARLRFLRDEEERAVEVQLEAR